MFPEGECALDVGAALAVCCPCEDFRNHGRYVSCVARAVNALRRGECLDRDARRSLKRCAARSTCSKPEGFIKCCLSAPGQCAKDGFCARIDDPNQQIECTSDEDCPGRPKCRITRNAEACVAHGGSLGTGSCCEGCGP